jgi:hypothetical protein
MSSQSTLVKLPDSAIDARVTVANAAARLALTISAVQNGDYVYQTDTTTLYQVTDQTALGTEAAFTAMATVAWGAVTGKPDASTTTKGIVQLATQAEVIAGTDSAKAVTSAMIQARLLDSRIWEPQGNVIFTGGGSTATGDSSGYLLRLASGTGVGFRVAGIPGFWNIPNGTGNSISFLGGTAHIGLIFSGDFIAGSATDETVIGRLTIGGGVSQSAPAYSDGTVFSARGFGIEFGVKNSLLSYRLIAHNGSAPNSGAWISTGVSASIAYGRLFTARLDLYGGIVSLYMNVSDTRNSALPTTATTTITGGPSDGINASGVYAAIVTNSTTPPAASASFRIYESRMYSGLSN